MGVAHRDITRLLFIWTLESQGIFYRDHRTSRIERSIRIELGQHFWRKEVENRRGVRFEEDIEKGGQKGARLNEEEDRQEKEIAFNENLRGILFALKLRTAGRQSGGQITCRIQAEDFWA